MTEKATLGFGLLCVLVGLWIGTVGAQPQPHPAGQEASDPRPSPPEPPSPAELRGGQVLRVLTKDPFPHQRLYLQRVLEHALSSDPRWGEVEVIYAPTGKDAETRLKTGLPDLVSVNSLAFARTGFRHYTPMFRYRNYRAAIVFRRDRPLSGLAELQGTRFGVVDDDSLSGYWIPLAALHEAGVHVTPILCSGSQREGRHYNVLLATAHGHVRAGGVFQGASRDRLEPFELEAGVLDEIVLSQQLPASLWAFSQRVLEDVELTERLRTAIRAFVEQMGPVQKEYWRAIYPVEEADLRLLRVMGDLVREWDKRLAAAGAGGRR
jgi:hypothetical protein